MNRFSSPIIKAGSGVARNFEKGGGGHDFHIFCRLLFGRTNLKLTKKQEKL